MRNRRGLSTVVGAVFFVIAATTVVSYISYSMNSIDQFSQSVIVAEAENINRGMEEISITQITIDGGEFNMTVVNTGSLPVHLTRLWVTDEDFVVSDKKADLDVRINPGNEKYNIGQGTGISADSTTSYTLKAVTERGNVATFRVSPDVSTNIRLLVPGSAINDEIFAVTLLNLNNSTSLNTIVNLEPILTSNVTLTQIGTNQSNVNSLKTGEMASFTWKYDAPKVSQSISFSGSYVGAPSGSNDISNVNIYDISEAQTATSSQWSEKARKVGILISGIPSPIDTKNNEGTVRFGIGIINPLDRPVEIYAVAVNTIAHQLFNEDMTGVEPLTFGEWGRAQKAGTSIIYWQGTDGPVLIGPENVGQFRFKGDIGSGLDVIESPVTVEALTSEGKMTITYHVTTGSLQYPTMNVFYTKDPSNPIGASDENWGYQINNVPSGGWLLYNATVENSSETANHVLQPSATARVAMTILIPSDFTYNLCTCSNSDWDLYDPIINADGSTFIKANATSSLAAGAFVTLQFNVTAPEVANDSLYVFQTTTYYPGWGEPLISAALSEAGVEVIPPPI